MSVLSYLREVPLFECLGKADFETLAGFCSLHRYEEGALLFYEEEHVGHLHLLLEGQIRVFKTDRLGNEIFLYFLESGDLITEFESLDRPACYANLGFAAPSQMLLIDFARFRELMRRNSALMESVLSAFINKTSRLQCALNREAVFDVTAKVAHFIRHHPDAFNRLKKQEVAARLNIQPETLSRVVRKLVRDKILLLEGDKIAVPDRERLESTYR